MERDLTPAILASRQCREVCETTLDYAVTHQVLNDAPHILGFIQDCIEISRANEAFLSRSSAQYAWTCVACAEMAGVCASALREYASDPQLRRCVDACRACDEVCGGMAV